MTDIAEWYEKIPKFTKWWLTLTVLFTLAGRLGLVHAASLIMTRYYVLQQYEVWRLITALFFYPLSPMNGFHFLVNCYFLYQYSIRLESDEFRGRPADYFYMLFINWLSCALIGLALDLNILMDCMVLSVLYVWCQLNKNTVVSFWFGTRFEAMYLPWVLFGFNFIIGGGGIYELIGILAGHIYYFLKFTHPQEYGVQSFLTTPSFLQDIFPNRDSSGGFGVPPTRTTTSTTTRFGGHNWGRGRVLGGEVD